MKDLMLTDCHGVDCEFSHGGMLRGLNISMNELKGFFRTRRFKEPTSP